MKARVLIAMASLSAGLLLGPVPAASQEAAPPMPDDPRAPRYHEVERGFFTGFEVGYLTMFKTPTGDAVRYPYAGSGGGRSNGFVAGVNAGYDITPRFALSIFALGGNSSASSSYGAFSLFAAGADLRLALFGARDADDVERLHVYLHGRGGLMVSAPQGLFGTSNGRDGYLAAGPGVEYFTRLRHFSVGLAADLAYAPRAKAAGLALTPTVKYTF